jgi:hypothetical protein
VDFLLVIVQPSVVIKSVTLSFRIRKFRSFLGDDRGFDSFHIQILEKVLQ